MEEGRPSWLPRPHFVWQSPNFNYSRASQVPGQSSSISACMNIHANMMSMNPTLPNEALPEQSHLQASGPHGWFYCLPRFRQAFTPAPSPGVQNKPPVAPEQNFMKAAAPTAGTESNQKRYLVFDQSGDQTTLVYSSLLGNPVQSLITQIPESLTDYHISGEGPGTRTLDYQSGRIQTKDLNGNQGDDVENGLQEDTEDLNALLYSDDDSQDIEDDEMSTGHSPNMMMVHDYQEQVASADGGTKRRKLDGDQFDVLSAVDTASSVDSNEYLELNEDAESSCAGSMNQGLEELVRFSGNKRMREEKIREAVRVLQSIIPGGRKGKDAVVVLDEAIQYLKSMKLEAMALGFKNL